MNFKSKKSDHAKEGICPSCGSVICSADFYDELSKKEFFISGLCQECQNETFK